MLYLEHPVYVYPSQSEPNGQCSMLVNHDSLNTLPKLFDKLPLALSISSPFDGQILPMINGDLASPNARVSVNYNTACLGENHPTGTDIPRPTSALPVRVDRPLSDSTQIQRGGTQCTRTVNHGAALGLVAAEAGPGVAFRGPVGTGAVGAPFDCDQAAIQAGQRLQRLEWESVPLCLYLRLLVSSVVDGHIAHKTALAFDAGVQLAREGVIDDADGRNALDREAQADADVRPAVHKVGGPVDRVHHERRLRAELHAGLVRLFAEERERRVQRLQPRRDERFDRLVRLRHQVRRVLLRPRRRRRQ